QRLSRQAGFASDVNARLVYFPVTVTEPRLAWEFSLWLKESADAYVIVIDAVNGVLLYRYNMTCYDENPLHPHGLVYTTESPRPHNPYTGVDSPPAVAQQDVPFRAEPFNDSSIFPLSDPHYDWWAGLPATGLVSNNTDTHLDRDFTQNQPDLPRLDVPTGNFSFLADLSASPVTEPTALAAQVNLFYWVNRYHDILYSFGFNEAAGNFQTNAFGLGGVNGDAVQADVQDGSGVNNANFSTPPDGSPGRVQMYLWTAFNPNRDGDFDQGVIIHELTHGLSNRLVGNATGLSGMQARGMGEGWSDYLGLVLLRSANEDPDGAYGVGQYVTNRYSRGIRRFPYSTSLGLNPLTLSDIAENTEVHAVGEIWCAMLWEMRRLLLDRYGFVEGQRQSIQLVVDGLKLTPPQPTMLDARDAIMLADRVNNGGANLCLITKAFAKRGAGFFATSTDANDASPVESFAEAPYCSDNGSLTLDRRNYLPGEVITVTLGDRNATPSQIVQVRSSVTGDTLSVALSPQSSIPGGFSATIPTSRGKANPGDGILQGSPESGDEVRITYHDASTANGSAVDVIATAGIARESAVLSDNVETGNLGWIPSGTWTVTSILSSSPSRSWLVRSAGNDAYLPSISLTSPLLDLSLFTDVTINFAQTFDLFGGFNYGVIEYSADDGVTWSRVKAYTGLLPVFAQATVRLPGLERKARARVRFVLQNAAPITSNFWAVDDISIIARSADTAAIASTVNKAPVIESIVPASGLPAGGTLVRITGLNFTESADTRVSFDGVPATDIQVLGDSVMMARTPAHAAGSVIVRISTRRGDSARAAAFRYFVPGSAAPAPSLSQIYPGSGSNAGGTPVTVFGSGFTPETVISFGGVTSQSTFVDDFTIRSVTPARPGTGPVGVQARNGTQLFTRDNGFTYTPPTPPQVQVEDPLLGGTVFAGSTLSIRWHSSDNRSVVKHRVFLRYLVGQTQLQTEVASDLGGGVQSFNWQVPLSQAVGTQARVYVVATDDEGAQTEAVSPEQFSIAQRWERVRAFAVGVSRAQSAADGNSLYLFGGRTGTTDAATSNAVIRYDPASNTWAGATLTVMPVGLNGGDAANLNGKVFIPGGFTAAALSSLHNAYDIAANAWLPRAASPVPVYLYSLATDAAAGAFHLTGGNNGVSGAVATARSYTAASDSWTELPAMTTARYSHKSAIIQGKLYVAGGVGALGGLTRCEVFDPGTKQWSPIASLNTPRSGAGGFVTQDAAGNPLWFLVGGINPSNNALLGAEAYDVNANRWIVLDNSYSMSAPRTSLASAVLGEFFYTLGGTTTSTPVATNERIRSDSIATVASNSTPILAAPEAIVGIVGEELTVSVTATDLGSPSPMGITASGLPEGATFSTSATGNNSVRGQLLWVPAEASRGKTFLVDFIASDGQQSDRRQTLLTIVDAAPFSAVNAADFKAGALASDSLVAAFGTGLAVRTEVAQAIPLPMDLAGTSVSVNGVPSPLLFVSPQQINFVLPSGLQSGPATIIIKSATGTYSFFRAMIAPSAPALFTLNQDGTGDAAAIATPDGSSYQNSPFDVTLDGRPNVLVLFGTGFRHATASNPGDENGVAESVNATIGGVAAEVLFAGAHGQFVGLDQLNIVLPATLAGGQVRRVGVALSVNGINANPVTVQIR
ncbi:MAG: M36 family metallopeptidase, partial [Acidobacteriota bacterium]